MILTAVSFVLGTIDCLAAADEVNATIEDGKHYT